MLELANSTHEAIEGLCSQFAILSGWQLRFLPGTRYEPLSVIQSALHSSPNCRWFDRVEDGEGTLGYLALDPVDGLATEFTTSSVDAIKFSESLLGLLNRMLRAERLLATRNTEVRTYNSLGKLSMEERDISSSLGDLLNAAVRLSRYHSAAFYLLNPQTNRLKLRIGYGLIEENMPATNRDLASSGPDLEALTSGHTFVTRKSPLDDRWLPTDAQCGLCVAVQSPLMPIGTLWVFDRRVHKPTESDLDAISTVTGHLAVLLERLVLYRETENQRRLQRELRQVSEHQTRMSTPDLPSTCGFQVAFRCQSRHEVGGDLCEVVSVTPTSSAIVVGDASGKSIPAALVMIAAKGALRSISLSHEVHEFEPTTAIQRLNRALSEVSCDHQFMSLLYALYNSEDRTFTYCNAGHPSPILVRHGEMTLLEEHGLLLGIMKDANYPSTTVELQLDDVIVLYSDGISEAGSEDKSLFGVQGIWDAISEVADQSVESILKRIWTEAERHIGQNVRKKVDDRTLLVMRIAK